MLEIRLGEWVASPDSKVPKESVFKLPDDAIAAHKIDVRRFSFEQHFPHTY